MPEPDYVVSAQGVHSPRILYGTAWKKQRTEELVSQAIACGFRGIDTACQPKHYYEAGVGAAVAASMRSGVERSQLYLQTKFTSLGGQDPKQVPYDRDAPLAEQVAQSIEVSLRNLQTHYLDCLVLHSPMRNMRDTEEVWQAMQASFASGTVRQLGISNCYDLSVLQHLHRWASVKPAVVQNRFYAETDYDVGIRSFCREHGILYQSFWTLTANPHVLAHEHTAWLAAKYHVTPAQVLFRYLTGIGIVPLSGTTSPVHMREDLAIFDFTLTDAERDSMGTLFGTLRSPQSPGG
jgi:diketogulonate reductase-like aldo/keto reductase